MSTNREELPESLRQLRAQYRAPQSPPGYLAGLEKRVMARTNAPVQVRRLWPRLAAVAASFLLLVVGSWFYNAKPDAPVAATEAELPTEAVYAAPAIDEDFLLSVVLLEAEDLVLPEEYLLDESVPLEEEALYLELF